MPKKNYFSFFSINFVISYFFSLLFLFQFIYSRNCENCPNNDPNICEKDCTLSYNGNYYLCEGINSYANGNYFLIRNQDDFCEVRTSCPDKIILDTKECVQYCKSPYYELGDFCILDVDFSSSHEFIDYLNRKIKCKFTNVQLIGENNFINV